MYKLDESQKQIIDECERQVESCNYTAAALFAWLKSVRVCRVLFITLPIVLGSIAGVRALEKAPEYEWVTAIAALLAGLFPAIFKALDLDVSMKAIADSANRFTTLRDRFRQAALIGATGATEDLAKEFNALMDRMDEARAASLAVPERFFKKAQKKIASGHYGFAVDNAERRTAKPTA